MIVANPLDRTGCSTRAEAFALGLADAVFEPADFLERSLAGPRGVLPGTSHARRSERTATRGVGGRRGGRRRTRWTRGCTAPRPRAYRALELRRGGPHRRPRRKAFAAEDEALADLLLSEELRAGLYAFDLVQRRAKRPAGAPDPALARPVTKVGVVGAGLMAGSARAAVRPPAGGAGRA